MKSRFLKYLVINRPFSWVALICIAVGLLAVDAMTKQLSVSYLATKGIEISIFKNFLGIDFSLTYATNTGAAWGYFYQFPELLLGLRLVLIIALIIYLVRFVTRADMRLPLVFIISGALGNVVDFFLYGHVVDMIHFVFWGYDYPVFNVADSAIFIGTAAIIWLSFRTQEVT